jgi:hypothetical protein
MSYHHRSFKNLFNKVNIPNISKNKFLIEYKKNITIPDKDKRPFSSLYSSQSTLSGKEITQKDITSNCFSHSHSNINKMNIKKNKMLRYYSTKTNNKFKDKNIHILYTASTTQTQAPPIVNKSKKSKNSINIFRNKFPCIDIQKNSLKFKNKALSSKNNFNTVNFRTFHKDKNNICINSNIDKIINNVIVDNKNDLLKEYKNQTINNFNNKYRLKYKTKVPQTHNKIIDVFSLLKQYKYEEEKKIDAIKTLTLTNEKIKKKNKRNVILQQFDEKDFEKNFLLIEKDFDINNKLKNNKKYFSIHTLDLLKK